MIGKLRIELELDLARSLSRYIGYTTGAYGIFRIANIPVSFGDKPSLYQFEILQPLMDNALGSGSHLKEQYAGEIINFAAGLRLVYKVPDGPTPHLTRYAYTAEGATIRAAWTFEEHEFIRFVLLGQILEFDSDAYCVLLDVLSRPHSEGFKYQSAFRERFEQLRNERLEWLQRAIPNRTFLDRIVSQQNILPWITRGRRGELSAKPLKSDFGRHHATPRRGWAIDLGHLTPDGKLTEEGIALIDAARGGASDYMWLGPPYGTQEALGIDPSEVRAGPFSPSWNLLHPNRPVESDSELEELVDITANYMDSHYDQLKLVHANQARIDSILPFVHFSERKLGFSVTTDTLFEQIFRSRPSLHVLSTRHSKYGYYQRRDR